MSHVSDRDRPELRKAMAETVESGFLGVSLRVHDERGEWVGSAGAAELGGAAKPPAVTGPTRLITLARRAAEAATWVPDDPRIAELAAAAAEHYLANPAMLKTVTGLQARTESAARYTLIAHHGQEPTPAAARLTALFETRLRAAGIPVPRPDTH